MTDDLILLVGAGSMAQEYAKVLRAINKKFIVVGRGKKSALDFSQTTGVPVEVGGLEAWIKKQTALPKTAIVAVDETSLGTVTLLLLKHGTSSILVEKPGGFLPKEIEKITLRAKKKNAKVFVAYNRRFYASVEKAKAIIKADGGVSSFTFEFTEWSHIIKPLKKGPGVKENWFLHNSTHVIDLAFHLGGWPKKISPYIASKTSWHPSGAIYAGSGISQNGAIFSYQANWLAPGRWSVEILTKKHRLIFKPLEKLQIQKIGSVAVEEEPINDENDQKFKPGLYEEVRSFLGNKKSLCTIAEQVNHLLFYNKIHG